MSKLIYITNTSLDGYIEDAAGNFNWVVPHEVFAAITDLLRPIGTHLYGRRMFETMAYWESPLDADAPERRDFARVWQNAQKIVFSRTLISATTRNTRIERDFDVEAIRKLKRESQHDITVGGADLASTAIAAGLVDECHLFVHSEIVGGGKPAFRAGLRRNLELLEARRYGAGVIHMHYRIPAIT